MKTVSFGLFFLLLLALALGAGIGYIVNIVHFVQHLNQPFDGTEWARLAGIPIFIIGCILGWFV
jgi:hypothetical protein